MGSSEEAVAKRRSAYSKIIIVGESGEDTIQRWY